MKQIVFQKVFGNQLFSLTSEFYMTSKIFNALQSKFFKYFIMGFDMSWVLRPNPGIHRNNKTCGTNPWVFSERFLMQKGAKMFKKLTVT